ncbi:MAG: epoxyqueuosine reductase QueH [Eubacteriales bacterium]|nr:epoxyqueuosine reductase QueH [Eubacteriales bacterium]
MADLLQNADISREQLQAGGLLLHACCGPCAEYPLKNYRSQGIQPLLFYYNPNIHPQKEWQRRYESLAQLAAAESSQLLLSRDYDQETWLAYGESPERCLFCYASRLRATARQAKDLGLKYFTTTLLISPYQDREAIVAAGEAAAEEFGVSFVAVDWRDHFREGQCLAREDGLYRQKYCGCLISLKNSQFKRKVGKSLLTFEPKDDTPKPQVLRLS